MPVDPDCGSAESHGSALHAVSGLDFKATEVDKCWQMAVGTRGHDGETIEQALAAGRAIGSVVSRPPVTCVLEHLEPRIGDLGPFKVPARLDVGTVLHGGIARDVLAELGTLRAAGELVRDVRPEVADTILPGCGVTGGEPARRPQGRS
jgi:hypothetical protein